MSILFMIVPKGFFPQQDNGTVFGGIRPAGYFVSGHAADATSRCVELSCRSRRADVLAFTGGAGGTNSGFIYIGLKPLAERKK